MKNVFIILTLKNEKMKKIIIQLILAPLILYSCSKDSKSSFTEGLEIGKHFLCSGDSSSNGILIQISNQSNKIGIKSVINGINYDNVVWVYNLPDSLKVIGKNIYFDYRLPVGSEIQLSPCNTMYLPLPNYPQIYITNVSSNKFP